MNILIRIIFIIILFPNLLFGQKEDIELDLYEGKYDQVMTYADSLLKEKQTCDSAMAIFLYFQVNRIVITKHDSNNKLEKSIAEDCDLLKEYYLSKANYFITDRSLDSADFFIQKYENHLPLDSINLDHFISFVFTSILHSRSGDYDLARKYAIKARNIGEQMDSPTMIAFANNALNNSSLVKADLENSINVLKMSLEMDISVSARITTLANISVSYGKLKMIDSSLLYIQQAIELKKKENLRKKHLYGTLANIKLISKNYEEAIKYYNKDYEELDSSNLFDRAINRLNVGITLQQQDRVKESFPYLKEAYKFASKTSNFNFLQFVKQNLATNYFKQGDYRRAYIHLSHVPPLKDSIYDANLSKSIRELEIKYETEKKEIQNELLVEQNKSQKSAIKLQRRGLGVIGLGLVSSVLGLLFYRTRKLAKEKELKSQEELLLLKQQESELLVDENNRLQQANTQLSKTIETYKDNPNQLLKEKWTISSPGNQKVIIPFQDMIAVQTEKKNRIAYLISNRDDRPAERRSLSSLEKDPSWPKHIFHRVYQSTIINLYQVETLNRSNSTVNMKGMERTLDVSIDKIDELEQLLKHLPR